MAFQCVVVTPEKQLLDQSVTQAILPAFDGMIGIETDRAPLLVKLGIGPLRVDLPGGASHHYLIEGGVAQMKDNHLTILTQVAIPAPQITADEIRTTETDAEAMRISDAPSRVAKQDAQKRAAAMRGLVGKA